MPPSAEIALHPDLKALLDDHVPFFCRLHQAGSLAPLAAVMDPEGEINGTALVSEEGDDNFTADDAISILTTQFIAAAQRGEIRASAIFYHGHDAGHPAILPAQTEEEANCIVAFLDHRGGDAVAAFFPYAKDPAGLWGYGEPRFVHKKPLIFGEGES